MNLNATDFPMNGERREGENRSNSKNRARRIVLCATGAYVVYTLPRIIMHLLHHVADDVQVVLSREAARMVSLQSVQATSRNHVFVELDESTADVFVPHIELARDADFILVYPATVNILGKVANGITDDLISALIIAAEIPVIFVPVSNPPMLNHPAVQRNTERLKADGYVVLPSMLGPEVATREHMDRIGEGFPMPTLLMQMQALLGDPAAPRGKANRN
jgi:phosphopantothenoylcysteine decarboxylase/phosphopantothenate--cysteine ligase